MKVEFIKSANHYIDIELISSKAEVCFFGRSNVGKSSLINSLFGNVAFTSKTPGKTVSLNFYSYGKFTITDSPGYGFAKGDMGDAWGVLASDYLKYREKLKMCFVLIDSRRGLMEVDLEMIDFIEHNKTKYTLVYTKIDKLNEAELKKIVNEDEIKLFEMQLKYLYTPESGFFKTSSSKRLNTASLLGFVNKTLSQNE